MINSRINPEFFKKRIQSEDEYNRKRFRYRLETNRTSPEFDNLQDLQKFINSLFAAETLLNTYGYVVSKSEES
jgi:hypothetical protein